jgi:8-oxo-dGTP pyrophosphatase MutT (NUDIX family)
VGAVLPMIYCKVIVFQCRHLEMNESWAECAAREIKEETNLDISVDPKFVHVTVSFKLLI